MDLKNKIAILTGASSGLGRAIAEKLVEKDVRVYGLARNIDALAEVRNELGEKFQPVRMDITNQEMLTNWINKTFSNKSIPDILINNAGAGSFNKIDETSSKEWLGMVNTNLNGMYFIT
ncbi:MAG TPA: SDR family NAD(P)-dependent oxidoreductase, partial [Flavobacteriaceae bacterium]|nr:SDR family NAD(P)-dependent oxidoreductase [Flavobacteriaceae bacterium]